MYVRFSLIYARVPGRAGSYFSSSILNTSALCCYADLGFKRKTDQIVEMRIRSLFIEIALN